MKRFAIIYKKRRCSQPLCRSKPLGLLAATLLMGLIIGCASTQVSPTFSPQSINAVRFRDRSQSEYDDEIRVTIAVPTAEENKALFSANLALKEIQPIWVKVENHSDKNYYLISSGSDPNYFSANETSLCTSSRIPEEVVYVLTKIVFENLNEFRRQHPALADLTKEGMLKGLTAPPHPGAVKYFREAGLVR